MRLGIYTDYAYRREGDAVYGERAFVTFLAEVARRLGSTAVLGRLNPHAGRFRYRLPDEVAFLPLPYYASAADPLASGAAMLRTVARFWRALRELDVVWVLGPHPLAVVLALLAVVRRRRLVLGVRQDYPEYARARYPGRRAPQLVMLALHIVFKLLARRHPVVAVGPQIARDYADSAALLETSISLVRRGDVAELSQALARDYDGELAVLSVGRLETEKNPLLLAEILARLDGARRWRLVICGEGPIRTQLEERLRALGVDDRAELRGYVPFEQLGELYRSCQLLLHVSWSEGLPQVLFEAFAAGLPTVATSVGSVPEVSEGAALLVAPGDAGAAADALQRLAEDDGLRARLVSAGIERVLERTLEQESARVADFLRTAGV